MKLLISNNTPVPISNTEILNLYKTLLINFIGKEYYIKLGYIRYKEFKQLRNYIHIKNLNNVEIRREDFPFKQEIRLACKVIKRHNEKEIIYPIRLIKEMQIEEPHRPYEFWIKKPKQSHSGPYTIQRNWNKLVKIFNYFQAKKMKTFATRERKRKRGKKKNV